MRLTRLSIDLRTYGPHEGRYAGTAHFENIHGSVEVALSPDMSDEVLKICADALVRNTKELAQNLTAATLTQVSAPAIENRS